MIEAWLEAHAFGYSQLSDEERTAIKDFALLWSLFEAYALGESGCADRILTKVTSLQAEGVLDVAPFAAPMGYFFQRYYDGTDLTPHYPHLHSRKGDKPELVEQVLRGHVADDASRLSVLLIIIYRLRNNLLHGPKWSYGIKGQLDNFRNANAVLSAFMERYW